MGLKMQGSLTEPPHVITVLNNLVEEFDPKTWMWLVSYSGGKDSTLILLSTLKLAEKYGFQFAVVYNDCGGDLPELRSLVLKVLELIKDLGHKIYITKPEKTFFDYLLTKYSPPRWNFRWCCKRLKERPFKKLVYELSCSHKVLNILGLRREEARWRNWKIRLVNENLVYAAPLVDFTSDMVWRHLEEICKLLDLTWIYQSLKKIYGGAERTGCWFCPLILHDEMLKSRKQLLELKIKVFTAWCSGRREEILKLSREYPDLIKITIKEEEIKDLYPCKKRCSQCRIPLHLRMWFMDLTS